MAGRVAIVAFCGVVTCTVALSACNRVAPPPPSNPGGDTSVVTTTTPPTPAMTTTPSVTVVTTTPPADGTTKLVIPTVGLPTQSSTVSRTETCGIPGVPCHFYDRREPSTTPPSTSIPNGPSGSGASPTTTP